MPAPTTEFQHPEAWSASTYGHLSDTAKHFIFNTLYEKEIKVMSMDVSTCLVFPIVRPIIGQYLSHCGPLIGPKN